MSNNSFCFFQNRDCEYFPCHETGTPEEFNCLFCFCPLYALGDKCGGNFRYTETGIKDCSACMVPHAPGGYAHVTAQFSKLAELAKRSEPEK